MAGSGKAVIKAIHSLEARETSGDYPEGMLLGRPHDGFDTDYRADATSTCIPVARKRGCNYLDTRKNRRCIDSFSGPRSHQNVCAAESIIPLSIGISGRGKVKNLGIPPML